MITNITNTITFYLIFPHSTSTFQIKRYTEQKCKNRSTKYITEPFILNKVIKIKPKQKVKVQLPGCVKFSTQGP